MKNNFLNELRIYFDSHQKSLAQNYSGLKFSRLEDDFLALKISSTEGMKAFIEKLEKGIPLEYITNQSFFYKSNFYVDEAVLIPRSETEILVEKALELTPEKKVRIIDIGTGSGVIIISYLLELKNKYEAYATDICAKAIAVAQRNAKTYDLNINFKLCDRLEGINDKFDVILTNPPYIKHFADRDGVHPKVLEHEPSRALFINDEDYIDWYSHFFLQIKNLLNDDGICMMEGHEEHLEQLQNLAIKIGLKNIEIIKDYTHRDRFLLIRH